MGRENGTNLPSMISMMIKAIILMTGILLLAPWVPAQQVEDVVLIDGEPRIVRADLLFRYLTDRCPEHLLDDFFEDFNDPYWPNYNRYWEVRKKRLYLLKIETKDEKVQYPLERLFVNYDGSPVFAEWFSGIMSYRSGDSPVIQLNRKYFEEEEVIRFQRGVVVERFKVNHRERWIEDSRRIMDQYRPLADVPRDRLPEEPSSEPEVVELLENAFNVVTHPEDGPSFYLPHIVIEFNADLDDFQVTEAHRNLTSYELLQTIAEETGTVLDVVVSNQAVIYEIRESEPAGATPSAVDKTMGEETPSKSGK